MKVKIFLVIFASIGFILYLLFQAFRFSDHKLHVVFCNVGQGDAIVIRTPELKTILIDSGPDNSVLSCLSSHLPFWDKTIDLAILSHPHEDHLAGFIPVLSSYQIKTFATENIKNTTPSYTKLQSVLKQKGILPLYLYSNDSFKIEPQISISILAPTEEFLHTTSPNGLIGERQEFASVIPFLRFGKKTFLFTGDTQAHELISALNSQNIRQIDVLQIPHHGSKTGFTKEVASLISASIGVISVGLNNQYHLPFPGTLTLLEEKGIDFRRTDRDGDIEFISDGDTIKLVQ